MSVEIVNRYSKETNTTSLGCANLRPYLDLGEGDYILDLGCGRGIQSPYYSDLVGEKGKVYGLDLTAKMIDYARENNSLPNVEYVVADIHALPYPDDHFNVVVSNCVINHSSDKQKVFCELHRVLKVGGYFLIGDVMSVHDLPPEVAGDPDNVAACWGGAIRRDRYVDIIKDIGFADIEILSSREYEKHGHELQSIIIKGVKK